MYCYEAIIKGGFMLVEKNNFIEITRKQPYCKTHSVFAVACKGTGEGFEDLTTKELFSIVLQWRRNLLAKFETQPSTFLSFINDGNAWLLVPKDSIATFRNTLSSVYCKVPNTENGVKTTWKILSEEDVDFLSKLI